MAAQLGLGFETDLSGLSKGMDQAAKLVDEGAGSMERAFASAGNMAEKVHTNVRSFTATLKSEGRMVAFWARDLGEMAGVGKEATKMLGEMGGVAAALLSGNALIIGIEAIKAGIALLRDIAKDAEGEIAKVTKQWDKYIDHIKETAGTTAQQLKQTELDRIYNEFQAARTKLEEKRAYALKGGDVGDPGRVAEYTKQIDTLTVAYQKEHDRLLDVQKTRMFDADLMRRTMGHNQGPESVKGETYIDTPRVKADVESRKALEEAKRMADEEHRHWLFLQDETNRIENRDIKDQEKREREALTEAQKMAAEELALRIRHSEQANKIEAKDIEKTQAEWMKYGHAVSDVINGMLFDSKTLAQEIGNVLRQMAEEAVNYFVEMGVKWIAAKIATRQAQKLANVGEIQSAASVAAAEAYVDALALGPFGLFAAPGAAATAFANVMAYSAGVMASAAGGWDVPGGGPFPAVLHAREMVLPRPEAEIVRGMARGGGSQGRGDTYHVQIVTHTPRDMERYLIANPKILRNVNASRVRNRQGGW
jgi:hypothetical protein